VSNTFTTKVQGKMSSRGWAIALGVGAIVLAAILLVVYLDRYRARVSGRNAPTPVLVAKRLIPKGTPGSIIASQSMYAPTTLPRKDVQVGAVSDAQYLVGRAASVDILPGSQFTAVDFAASDTGAVDSQITGKQRAITVSVDSVHASTPQVQAGDSVDIYINLGGRGASGAPLVKLFASNVKVLAVPSTAGPEGPNAAFTLRIDTKDAAKFAYMADNTQQYWVIRPVSGAKPTARSSATLDSVLR
jgi:Flp pilus assembly protein CpaB